MPIINNISLCCFQPEKVNFSLFIVAEALSEMMGLPLLYSSTNVDFEFF